MVNIPLKQSQGWGSTSAPLGITGDFATPPQVITEAWSTPPQVITFCNKRRNFFTDEKNCGRTENMFTKALCDKNFSAFMNYAIKTRGLS